MVKYVFIIAIFLVQIISFFSKSSILQNQYYSIKRYFLYIKNNKYVYVRYFSLFICFIFTFLKKELYLFSLLFLIDPFINKINNIKLSKRLTIQLIVYVIIISLNFLILINDKFIYFLLAYNIFAYYISFFISLFIEKIKQRYFINKAKQKLKQYNVKIIAITGSFGKTSCKNYIYELIKDNYNVLKSKRSFNTLNGILLTINNYLKPYHNILLLEIGVDEKNGMNKFIKNFSFDITAITCIGNQHLKTFKSIDNVFKEKSKLLLANKQCGIVNIDDDFIKNCKIKNKITFSCKDSSADIFICPFKSNQILIKIFKNKYITDTNLLGKHNLSNLALSIAACKTLNIDDETIINKVSKLKNVKHRLSTFSINQWLIIDDSYNSNINGFINALEVLSSFKEKKVIITPGIIEQDDFSKTNYILASKIKECCDLILLVNNPPFSYLIDNKLSFNCFKDAYTFLKENYFNEKLVILIENDLPDIFLR